MTGGHNSSVSPSFRGDIFAQVGAHFDVDFVRVERRDGSGENGVQNEVSIGQAVGEISCKLIFQKIAAAQEDTKNTISQRRKTSTARRC